MPTPIRGGMIDRRMGIYGSSGKTTNPLGGLGVFIGLLAAACSAVLWVHYFDPTTTMFGDVSLRIATGGPRVAAHDPRGDLRADGRDRRDRRGARRTRERHDRRVAAARDRRASATRCSTGSRARPGGSAHPSEPRPPRVGVRAALRQLVRDDHALDLARALPDPVDAELAVEPLDRAGRACSRGPRRSARPCRSRGRPSRSTRASPRSPRRGSACGRRRRARPPSTRGRASTSPP